jgi:crossover junction endodeoxyribonuclease RusA
MVEGREAGAGLSGDARGADKGHEVAVTLGWPSKLLSPNTRSHWAAKSKAAKAYRQAAAWSMVAAGIPLFGAQSLILLEVTFVEPDKRRRDLDNMLAAIKSGIDGIADALGVNDRRFVFKINRSDEIGGMVKVRISEVVA